MSTQGDPLGVDVYCTTGFPTDWRLTYGQENAQCAAIRRLNAAEGCLEAIGDDPDYGLDVADHLNASGTPASLAALGSRARAELSKDPRFDQLEVQATHSGDTTSFVISGTTAKGPFTMVAAVGDAGVDFLNQGLSGQVPVGSAAVATTVTIVSQTGMRGAPGIPGASVGGGAGAALLPNLDGYYASDSVTETMVDEDQQDFSRLAGSTATIALSCYARVPSGGTGTVRIRVGGTSGVATDGTVVATLTVTSSGAFALMQASGTFARPTGTQPVKLTLQAGTEGNDLLVKQTVATIT